MDAGAKEPSGHARPQVVVVDDDESVRESLPDLLRELGCDVRAFDSAEAYLAAGPPAGTDCLILDVVMPGMSGLELQRALAAGEYDAPIVFITAGEDRSVQRRVLQAGAIACLRKPFSEAALRAALDSALRTRRAPPTTETP